MLAGFVKIKFFFISPWFSRAIIIVALLFWYGFFLFHPIDLIPADLGRHLKNGELIFSDSRTFKALTHTNLYSANFADFPFINHHWGSGVIFLGLYRLGSFALLSVFFIVVSLAALVFVFDAARKAAGLYPATLVAIFLIPLLAERTEARPEVFTYLFAAVFWWILWHYRNGRFTARALWLLPFIQLLWVNLHIYFFVGPLLIGIFWLDALVSKEKNRQRMKELALALAVAALINLANPNGLAGVLYPLRIFGNYGFQVAENQSVVTTGARDPLYANLLVFKLAFFALLGAFVVAFLKRRRQFPVGYFLLMILVSVLAWRSVRNLTLFALLALPVGAELIRLLLPKPPPLKHRSARLVCLVAMVVIATIWISRARIIETAKMAGLGLRPGNRAAADFILKNNLNGPLFNDFDIGGYAIFYLYPRWRPFADNRPEAYPATFFTETYVPMQTDEKVWQAKEKEYGFNLLLYSFQDRAPWAVPFIVRRLLDPSWAPVFADQYAIIFLKRNEQNAELIKNYEIPRDRFGLQKIK